MAAVTFPFDALVLDEAFEGVVSEGCAQEGRSLGLFDRLDQAAGEHLDAARFAVRGRHLEDVLLDWRRQRTFVFDAVQAGRQHHGEGEVRVAGRIGRAVLDARVSFAPGFVLGDADQVAAVALRPAQVDGRLEARQQPLVAVHPLVRNQRQRPRVVQQPGHIAARDGAQVVRVFEVEEGVAFALEEGLVDVHAAAVLVHHGLRHERCVDAVGARYLLHHQAVGHRRVGHRQCVGVAQGDLVLAGGHFVVAVFHLDAHRFEGQDGIAAQVVGGVRRLVEVAAAVERFGAFRILEVEVLQFGADVEGVAEVRGALQVAAEDVARVAFKWRAVWMVDIAEHARDARFPGPPGDELEGCWVGPGEHVGLIDAREAFDAGAIEAHALVKRLFELLDGDREALQRADDIREPETDELHVVFAAGGDNVAGGFAHGESSCVTGSV